MNIVFATTAGLLVCCTSSSLSRDTSVVVEVSNPSPFARRGEIVSLPWSDVRKAHPSFTSANAVVIDGKSAAELLSQATEDDFLFQSDFEANESRSFAVKTGSPRDTPAGKLVDGRFVEPRQDYAWENDRIAFRMYGPAMAADVRNGIDVWTKRVRSLIVAKWYRGEADTGTAKVSYHVDHGEGADFFSVGKSLGAGGSGVWFQGRLHQPGVFSSQKTICNGPLRVTFELTYNTLVVDSTALRETRRISLDAGQNLNRIDVRFTGRFPGDTLLVACGLAKRKGTVRSGSDTSAWMGLWGATNGDAVNGFLGTGIVVMRSSFAGTAEDTEHHLVLGRIRTGETFTYYAGAGWTRSGDFAGADDWNRHIEEYARRVHEPVRITSIKQR